MSLKEALESFAVAFHAYHDRHVLGNTAHNAECIGVRMELFPESEGNQLSGTIILEGARTDLPDNPVGNLQSMLFTEETSNQIEFDSIEQLVEILTPPAHL